MYLNYTIHFGNNDVADLALSTYKFFNRFVTNTLVKLLELGDKLLVVKKECLKLDSGKKKFAQWLGSMDFGGSRYIAETAIKLAQWYHDIPKALQKLVRMKANSWSAAALKYLPKLANAVVEQVVISGKKTEKQLKELLPQPLKATLTPGEELQEEDWDLVINVFDLKPDQLEQIKATLADIEQPTTDNLIEALTKLGYDVLQVLPKPPKKAKQPLYTEAEMKVKIEEAVQQALLKVAVTESASPQEKLFTESEIQQQVSGVMPQEMPQERYAPPTYQENLIIPKEVKQEASPIVADVQIYLNQINELQLLLTQQQQLLAEQQQQAAEKEAFGQTMLEQVQHLEKQLSALTTEKSQPKAKTEPKQSSSNIGEENHKLLLEVKVVTLEKEKEELAEQYAKLERDYAQVQEKLDKYNYLEFPLNDSLIDPGAYVKVIVDDQGGRGYTGTVINKNSEGPGWWVLLDEIKAQGSTTLNLYKATQLTFCGQLATL